MSLCGAERSLIEKDEAAAVAQSPTWLQDAGDPQKLTGHLSYQSQQGGDEELQLGGQYAGGFFLGREGTELSCIPMNGGEKPHRPGESHMGTSQAKSSKRMKGGTC